MQFPGVCRLRAEPLPLVGAAVHNSVVWPARVAERGRMTVPPWRQHTGGGCAFAPITLSTAAARRGFRHAGIGIGMLSVTRSGNVSRTGFTRAERMSRRCSKNCPQGTVDIRNAWHVRQGVVPRKRISRKEVPCEMCFEVSSSAAAASFKQLFTGRCGYIFTTRLGASACNGPCPWNSLRKNAHAALLPSAVEIACIRPNSCPQLIVDIHDARRRPKGRAVQCVLAKPNVDARLDDAAAGRGGRARSLKQLSTGNCGYL